MKQKRSYSLARAAMTLFLVMLTSIASWATGGTLAGSGTSSDPYVIVDADDWGTFVNWINNSNSTYASKYYKLGADITISSMAGTKSGSSTLIPFKGTFDGDGHTITLNNLSSVLHSAMSMVLPLSVSTQLERLKLVLTLLTTSIALVLLVIVEVQPPLPTAGAAWLLPVRSTRMVPTVVS